MSDANDILFGNAAPAVSFSVGTTVRGRLTGQTAIQRREVKYNKAQKAHEQGKPLYWENGRPSTVPTDRPIMDAVVTLQTDFTKWEAVSAQTAKIGKDDGLRRVFLKGRSKANPGSLMDAAVSAAKEAGVRKVEIGDFMEITCTGEGEKIGSVNPPKIYEAKYWTADNAPDWASALPGAAMSGDTDEDPDDNPFA